MRVTTYHHGYLRVHIPGHPLADKAGRVALHRLVVHDAGIPVPPNHVVHHKNGNRSDNRLENLEVMPHGAHTRLHRRLVGDEDAQRMRERLAEGATRQQIADEFGIAKPTTYRYAPGDSSLSTHCGKGHEFTPENTGIHNGRRECCECRRLRARARTKRRNAQGLRADNKPFVRPRRSEEASCG